MKFCSRLEDIWRNSILKNLQELWENLVEIEGNIDEIMFFFNSRKEWLNENLMNYEDTSIVILEKCCCPCEEVSGWIQKNLLG